MILGKHRCLKTKTTVARRRYSSGLKLDLDRSGSKILLPDGLASEIESWFPAPPASSRPSVLLSDESWLEHLRERVELNNNLDFPGLWTQKPIWVWSTFSWFLFFKTASVLWLAVLRICLISARTKCYTYLNFRAKITEKALIMIFWRENSNGSFDAIFWKC